MHGQAHIKLKQIPVYDNSPGWTW